MHAYTLKPIIVVGVAQRKLMENSPGGGGLSNEHARAREGRGRNFDGLELFTCSKPPLRKNQFAEMQFMSDNLGSCSITLPDVCTLCLRKRLEELGVPRARPDAETRNPSKLVMTGLQAGIDS